MIGADLACVLWRYGLAAIYTRSEKRDWGGESDGVGARRRRVRDGVGVRRQWKREEIKCTSS